MTSPFDRVRASTERVMAESELVRIVPEGISRLADGLDLELVERLYAWDRDFHFEGPEERVIDYVFTLDALNFGSGFSPYWKAGRAASTYVTVASALKRHAESGGPLHAELGSQVTPRWIADLLGMDPGFPLAGMYATALRETAEWVAGRFGGYGKLLESLPPIGRGAALVELLTSNLRCFDDRTAYRGFEVCFYKRAQILVNDLSLALRGGGLGRFDDIASLTMFADNLVPHVLRVEGALDYSPDLLERIEDGEALAPGSAEEVQIRAAGVQGVERIVREVSDRGDRSLFPALVDVYLWNLGQEPRFKSRPRHLCRTFYY